jgi:DNA processing protein
LDELPEPPQKLRVAGTLPFLDRAVAVVGTRRASPAGLELAGHIARELSSAGFVVISGGAEGIDAAAHEGAIAGGSSTIAVLAGGLDRLYPRMHEPLFSRIADQGAVLTEAEDHEAPRPHFFLSRNRLIAALARAVIVVQAPLRSGALSTAMHARKLGRPIFALPWSLNDVRGEGGLALLAKEHARVCLGAADVIELVSGERPKEGKKARKRRPVLDADQRLVLDALSERSMHVDELVMLTGLPVVRVQTTLMALVLMGQTYADDQGGFFRARP